MNTIAKPKRSKGRGQPIALRIVELRKAHGMRQYELANSLSLTASMLAKYEGGLCQPSIETLVALSRVLATTVDYLVGASRYNLYTAVSGLGPEPSMEEYLRCVLFSSSYPRLSHLRYLSPESIDEKLGRIIRILS